MSSFRIICVLSLFGLVFAAFRIEPAHEIEIIGNKFFNSSSGNQFFIRGVAYQRTRKPGEIYDAEIETSYVDSLANPSMCLKDLEFLKELGINTVRVYQVDPTKNHDVCMNAFSSHGIYVLVDLSEPQKSIIQTRPSWDVDLFKRYTDVVDSMHGFTNVLGFIAGNEVLNKVENSDSAAFVKASVRDVKNYIRDKKYRRIPVGYASADDTLTRLESANFFVCSDNNTESAVVDFYALNMFEWCGYSSYATSGYKERTIEFSQSPVPVFFSEYGCNAVRPRPFTEIDSIYGPIMSQVWSGAVLYEFFQNENRFGLVDENAVGHIIKLEDYNIVKLRLVESIPRSIHRDEMPGSYSFSLKCPAISSSWNSSHILPPTPDDGICDCLQASLSCVVAPYTRVNFHELIREVCSKTDCREIMTHGSTGVYGKYSGCSPMTRASYALNKYFIDNHKKPASCDFGNRAALTTSFGALGFRKTHIADGRTCEEILASAPDEMENKSESIAPNPEEVMSTNVDHLKSAAQRPGMWDLLMVSVFIISFMYLAT
ncbi:hypothetical protein JCM33374_g2166 [Metschnikowia sp. JCM 33374]|nr:hypothetical protein JCM33374_g2166 [Metschnikowia sp. JCM 33374]